MSKIIDEQLKMLQNLPQKTEGNETVFYRKTVSTNENIVKVTFQDYFITGFPGFDFHEKFNNGIAPYTTVMYGEIEKETEKMYKFKEMHSDTSDKMWAGWCPKKSCTVKKIGG